MKKISLFSLMILPFALVACGDAEKEGTAIAQIGNETVYQEDLDFISHSMGVNRGADYKKNVENLFANAALVSEIVKEMPELQKDWERYSKGLEDRLLALTYQRFFAMECLQYPDSQLRQYFNAHKNKFGGDSVKFMDVRNKVAERVFFVDNADSLSKYIQENIHTKDVPARLDLLHFEGKKDEAIKKLAELDAAKPNEEVPGFAKAYVREDYEIGLFKNAALKPYLFGDSLMIAGKSRVVALNDTNLYMAIKILKRTPKIIADTGMYRGEFERNYVYDYRQKMVGSVTEKLLKKYALKIEEIKPPSLKEFYEQNKSMYKRSSGFEVYHVESHDSSALATLFASPVESLQAFKDIAVKSSENKETASNGGFVGVVLKDHALPYGIGLAGQLFEEFEGKKVGYVSGVIRSESTPNYHVFYLAKVVPEETKPLERVEFMVKHALERGAYFDLDSSYVLATENGKPLVLERDVQNLFKEEPGLVRGGRSRERIVSMLVESHAFATEARSENLDKSWEFKAMKRHSRANYIVENYRMKLVEKTDISEDSLKSIYDKVGNPLRRGASFEESKRDLVDYVVFPKNRLLHEYYYAYFLSKGLSFEENKPRLVLENISRERELQLDRLQLHAWNKSKVVYFVDGLNMSNRLKTAEQLVAEADSLYKIQKIEPAVVALKLIRDLYPENDSLFAYATFAIAQMQSESEEDFDLAQSEYFTYYRMWPDSPDAEKAMFSRGFILNENLHRDSDALEVLEEFQQKYPKSELKESVDWLVENIKSNGKLADDLMKKISEE